MKPPLAAIVGPTASGKSRMAIEVCLALHANCEIVSCDSMAVYRGLDVSADKPAPTQRRGVPHHLFDVADPTEEFTAARYRELARAAIASIHERGNLPVLVGGSGLWFRAVVDDLSLAPTDPSVRRRLEDDDPDELYASLLSADPASAERIGRSNPRRVVRALEIMELTGRPPTELRGEWQRREGPYRLAAVGLTWDRARLLELAERRVDDELEAGLVEEVRRLAETGLSRTAKQALGVKEILEHVEGRLSLPEARALLVRNTKRFVRRQLSWFRADPRIEWVDASQLGWEGARQRIVDRFRALL